MVLALFCALGLMLKDFSTELIWFTPVAVIALCYTTAFIPYREEWLRLRDIPYLKIILIVGVVTYITFYIPLLYGDFRDFQEFYSRPIVLYILSRSMFLFAITLPFDIRDLDFDKSTGLKTIPGKIGVRKSKFLSLGALAMFLLAESLIYHLFSTSGAVYLAMFGSALLAAIFILEAKPNGSEYFYSLGLEGTMIIQLLLIMGAMHLLGQS